MLFFQEERGGPAIYSEGDVTFHKEALFQGNGQYEAYAQGESPSNQPGGAILTAGTMEVRRDVIPQKWDDPYRTRLIFYHRSMILFRQEVLPCPEKFGHNTA